MKQTPYSRDRNNQLFEVFTIGMRAFGAQINTEVVTVPLNGHAGDLTVVVHHHHSV